MPSLRCQSIKYREALRCLALLAILLATPGVASAGVRPQFVLGWGEFGAGPGQFHIPRGIALTPGGNIVVVDEINNRIQVFSAGGDFLAVWSVGTEQPDGVLVPRGICSDNAGDVFVTQENFDLIQHFSPTGTHVGSWSRYPLAPMDVVSPSVGELYVAEEDGHKVEVIGTNDGVPLRSFGSSGTGPGQFQRIWGLGLGLNGDILVADWQANRIQVFSSSGVFLRSIGAPGSGPGEFNQPIDVAVDATGRIFVTDFANHRIQAFSYAGSYLLEWGGYGIEPGELRYPWGIAIGPDGDIYVTDTGNHRVQRFSFSVAVQTTTWSSIKAMYAGP